MGKCCRNCCDSNSIITIKNKKCDNTVTTNNWTQFVVSEIVELEEGYPDIDSIVNVIVKGVILKHNIVLTPDSIEKTNAEGSKLTGYKISVKGKLIQTILYETGECGTVFTVKSEMPFSEYVVMDPKYNFSKEPCIKICIEDVLITKISCREILKTVSILIKID